MKSLQVSKHDFIGMLVKCTSDDFATEHEGKFALTAE